MKRKPLGKGLDALIGDNDRARYGYESPEDERLISIAIDQIIPNDAQPRKDIPIDTLQELANSIKQQGIVQPILVRKSDDQSNQFQIIAGERRWRASKLAGLKIIPAIIKAVDDRSLMVMALVENIQREDLNPMEEANALKKIQHDHELTHGELAEIVGKSRSAVSNLIRLTSLHDNVKQMLTNGDLEMGHARSLLVLSADQQLMVAKKIVEDELSVRQTERLIKDLNSKVNDNKPIEKTNIQDMVSLEKELKKALGVNVKIQDKQGKGKIILFYQNAQTLDGLVSEIKKIKPLAMVEG